MSGAKRPSARERWGRPAALTIAGSDSGGGAGIQADLKTFQALGVYGMSAITALTAQNTIGVWAVQEVLPEIVAAQIDAVAEDIGVDGAKTGMLSSAPIIRAVADRVRHWDLGPVLVVDPVMVAKSGDRLLREDAVRALIDELLPLAAVVTPNLPEAEVLVGHALTTDDDLRAAAREIVALGPRAVVIKGGHREGDATDLFFDGRQELRLEARRIDTRSTHGTGCTFSAAIAARIALGDELADAVRAAKAYLTAAIEHAAPLGAGHGPVAHEWALRRTTG
ncbi:MAG: bifunctional hydroxymethylpyrimidine kinase/phosphomethylpyrimidine kinase [Chloroflexi bacterium]|nr:bifunctional hydroxymethylpyrimidine kinase/phosphomethylpyrimidine kinase [Chloroflexota bacterium]